MVEEQNKKKKFFQEKLKVRLKEKLNRKNKKKDFKERTVVGRVGFTENTKKNETVN